MSTYAPSPAQPVPAVAFHDVPGQLDTSSIGGFFSSIPTWLSDPSPFPAVANWLFYGGLAVAADLFINRKGRH